MAGNNAAAQVVVADRPLLGMIIPRAEPRCGAGSGAIGSRQGLLNNAEGLDALRSVHRLLDGLEVDHRAPRRPNPLHGGRRVVRRIGLGGHELLRERDRLPDCPGHPIISLTMQRALRTALKSLSLSITDLFPAARWPGHRDTLALSISGLSPRTTRIRCAAPSSASWIYMLSLASGAPSSSRDDNPRATPRGFSTTTS